MEVSQPSSKIPFVGRIYAEIFRKTATGEETTGVKVYSGLLELTKPSVTDVTLWASETVDLPLGGGIISCFILMTAMLRHFRPVH